MLLVTNLCATDITLSNVLSPSFLLTFLVISELLEHTHCFIVPEPQLLVLSVELRVRISPSEVSSLIPPCGYDSTWEFKWFILLYFFPCILRFLFFKNFDFKNFDFKTFLLISIPFPVSCFATFLEPRSSLNTKGASLHLDKIRIFMPLEST
uniref:Uncharacterized protein n=1 Tax=Arundo donax TaxID=35708 RepID=A0A0A8XVN4_ARUDO